MMMLGVEKDMEIEEGEASYYGNDPEIALSYIDEKIQDILGHFQKDFEGGVSAENLGAKFGGYGSFLPSYARSPACSQQRTTSEVIDGKIPNSPKNLDFENQLTLQHSQLSSLASPCSSLPPMLDASSTADPNGRRYVNGRIKGDGRVPLNSVETPTLKGQQKSMLPYDQKTLKVRLKVGSNNLPARKNAEIYSGLGLDGSPSPSLNDSYTHSEGLSHDIRNPSGNSPTSILKIMTSFLLQGTQLLSPLSEELMRFTEKKKYLGESVSKTVHKGKVNGYHSRKDPHGPLPEKKIDSFENGEFLEAGEHRNMGFLLKQETDINDLACEELVTNALKHPLLSNMQPGPPYHAEGTVKAADLPSASKKVLSRTRLEEEQSLEHETAQEIGKIQKSEENVGQSANISILEGENCVDNCTVSKKQSRRKGERNIVLAKVDSGLPDRERDPNAEPFDSRETKISQADVYNTDFIRKQSQGEEQLCELGRNKLEGNQIHDSMSKFSSHRRSNGSHVNSLFPKNDSVNTRKGLKKITNKYHEFFGNLDFEQDDNEVASNEVSSVKKLINSKFKENGSTFEEIRIRKEASSVGKTGKPCKAEEYLSASLNENVSSTVAGPKADAKSSIPAPELKDYWVQCDKCQKWRLLPLGIHPSSLPEKWMCSMLDWLIDMNRCTYSEEETTNAVKAFYQASAPLGTECKPPAHLGNNFSVVSSTGVSHSVHNGQMFDHQTSHTGVKKKQKSKDEWGEPLQPSKSMKGPQKKNRSWLSVSQSSLVDAYGDQYVGQCSSSLSEKHANKPHKKSLVDSYSGEVDAKKLKARKNRQSDSDSSRSSKKVKSQDVLDNHEIHMVAPPVHLSKSGHCIENISLNHMPRKDKRTIDGHPKEVEDESFNHITGTEVTYDASLPNHKRDAKSSSKKKKGQEEQVIHSYVEDLPQVGHQSRGRSEDNQRRLKKTRPSHSEGKDQTTKKSTCETGRKARKSTDQQIRQERGSSRNADSLKRDLGSAHPSGASTSSSSKVSGLFKIKTKRQEVKGSPVDSVSLSPLRVQSTDKCASTLRYPQEKNDREGTYADNCTPRRFIGVATNKVNHSTSVESSVVDLHDQDLGFLSGIKIEEENRSASDFATQPISDAGSKGSQNTCKNQESERYQDDRKEDQTFNGGKSKFQEPCVSFDMDEKNLISEKSSGVKDIGGIRGRDNKFAPVYNDHLDNKLHMTENIVLARDAQDSSNKLYPDIKNASVVSGRAHSLPPSARYKNDKRAHLPVISGPHKEKEADITLSDAHGDASKALEHNKKGEKQNGSTPSRHSNATIYKVRDHDGSSVRKDSRSQAATNAMKEAKDLKRLADRFKNSGSADSTGMYFEAALKFLYGASLLESGSRESNKHNDIQCIDMYRSTAKFCEFCAHEYERSKDMASASLAYKCMEVSYMRVIYSSYGNTNRDRNEVQMALQIVPPGESPASSASDVDNLNNPVTVDKVCATKGMTSPQVAGNTGITARNRSSFTRLLEFAQDVSAAMDAAKKSRATFAAANLRSGDANSGDDFSSVKRALDFNFQDVDGLLRLIRIAKDAINR